MTSLLDLEGHLVFYRSYHFNHTNVTIHLLCIPVILFSAFALFVPVQVGSWLPYINVGTVAALAYAAFYTLLDPTLGSLTVPLLVGGLYYLSKGYQLAASPESSITQSEFHNVALTAHIIAWLAQFYGHGVHEKRAPALTDNLLQALVLAPFFVVFEVAFALGFRRELKKTMDNKAGKAVRDFKFKEAAKKKELEVKGNNHTL